MMPPQPGIMPFIVYKRIGEMRLHKCAYTLASKPFVDFFIYKHCKFQYYSVILQKEYTYLKSKELEELPCSRVMSWQPF